MLIIRFNQYDEAREARLIEGPVEVGPGAYSIDCLFVNTPNMAEMLVSNGDPVCAGCYTVFE